MRKHILIVLALAIVILGLKLCPDLLYLPGALWQTAVAAFHFGSSAGTP